MPKTSTFRVGDLKLLESQELPRNIRRAAGWLQLYANEPRDLPSTLAGDSDARSQKYTEVYRLAVLMINTLPTKHSLLRFVHTFMWLTDWSVTASIHKSSNKSQPLPLYQGWGLQYLSVDFVCKPPVWGLCRLDYTVDAPSINACKRSLENVRSNWMVFFMD